MGGARVEHDALRAFAWVGNALATHTIIAYWVLSAVWDTMGLAGLRLGVGRGLRVVLYDTTQNKVPHTHIQSTFTQS